MIIDLLFLVVGLIGLFFSIRFLAILRRSDLDKINQTTYSKNVNRGQIESGIYIEHGMVNNSDKNVHAEYKLSNSYFESIH